MVLYSAYTVHMCTSQYNNSPVKNCNYTVVMAEQYMLTYVQRKVLKTNYIYVNPYRVHYKKLEWHKCVKNTIRT